MREIANGRERMNLKGKRWFVHKGRRTLLPAVLYAGGSGFLLDRVEFFRIRVLGLGSTLSGCPIVLDQAKTKRN